MLNYEQPLYEQRGLIQPTPALHAQAPHQREPLIFTIGIRDGIRRFLVIRDVAGEDLESGDMRAPRFRYFGNADAVFFMFDPLRVKAIRDQLHDLLPAQSFSAGDPRALLTNVLLAIGAGRPKLAIILSKFDALRALGEVEGSEWSQIMSNAGAAYCVTTRPARTTTTATASCCTRRCAACCFGCTRDRSSPRSKAIPRAAQSMHRYFVVSALGQPHAGDRLSSRGITPFRCTDPLRWITSRAVCCSRETSRPDVGTQCLSLCAGRGALAVAAVWCAHRMFGRPDLRTQHVLVAGASAATLGFSSRD